MISFLEPAPSITPLPADRIDAEYKRLRLQVFIGIFVGYAGFYLVRKNFSVAMPDILKEYPQYSKAELGSALTGLAVAYGFSKFLMGSVSDRSNPRYFLPLGLLLSSALMMCFGWFKFIYSSLTLMIVLQTLNGWLNGMGWAPCGKTMVHWFSTSERGRVVSVWNLAHNVGGAMMAVVATWGVAIFHDWGARFYFNGIVASIVALIAFMLMRDTPQSCGLPSIEAHKNDYPPNYNAQFESTLSFRQIFMEHVFTNRLLWAIAFANAFVYFMRYGVADWIPTYLQTAKGFSADDSKNAIVAFEWAGVPGTILAGWMSDKYFRSRRAPATILFMVPTIIGLAVYGLNRNGPLWIDISALITIGFFIYGPIMLIGLQALDMVPKKAAGTAAGFTGFFGYVFGTAVSGAGVGWLADHWGWNGVIIAMLVCAVMTMLFSALTLGHRAESSAQA
ncbi:MAG: phosphoglycerate transporter protein PgtP [Verrucomicrobiaceae bacterium]|nr:phosphoglycerate transporter protein PgtP [Verrucomicrobiaceae bacterium]